MKVLFIVSSSSKFGGSSKSFYTLCSELIKHKIELTITLPKKEGMYYDLAHMGVKTYIVPVKLNVYPPINTIKNKILFFPRMILWSLKNIQGYNRLKEICVKERPDIIHSNVGPINIGYKVAKKFNIPHIYHLREYQDLDFNIEWIPCKKDFIKKLHLNNFSICITKDIQKHFSLNSNNSTVIYNGIVSEKHGTQFTIKNRIEKKKYFLFAGRVEQAKGIIECIKGFKLFSENDDTGYELWIAGAQPYHEFLESIIKLIKEYNLENRIKLLGEREDINELMNNATALIMSSRNEGFGRTTAESMLNGCLVIGKNTGGTKEQFDNGKELTGKEIGLRYTDEIGLSKALNASIMMDEEEYKNYLNRAYETVKTLYSNKSYAQNVVKVYKKLLNLTDYI